MSKAASINKINETELQCGIAGTSASWHQQYSSSCTIYIGGLPSTHTEQHILSIFEQYGTLTHVNLIRDPQTNQSKQFAFANYADARSAILAVDNLNAVKIDGSTLSVDHVNEYRMPQPPEAYDTTPFVPPITDTHSGTPSEDSVANYHPPNTTTPIHIVRQKEAERKRQIGVMERLQKLRNKRRRTGTKNLNDEQPPPQLQQQETTDSILPSSDSQHPTDYPNDPNALRPNSTNSLPNRTTQTATMSADERQQKSIEKERRRAERARTRQARIEKRAQRNRQNR